MAMLEIYKIFRETTPIVVKSYFKDITYSQYKTVSDLDIESFQLNVLYAFIDPDGILIILVE